MIRRTNHTYKGAAPILVASGELYWEKPLFIHPLGIMGSHLGDLPGKLNNRGNETDWSKKGRLNTNSWPLIKVDDAVR